MVVLLVAESTLTLIAAAITPTIAILAAIWRMYSALTSRYDRDRTADKSEILAKMADAHLATQATDEQHIQSIHDRMAAYEVRNSLEHKDIIDRQDLTNGRMLILEGANVEVAKSEASQDIQLARIEGRLDGRDEGDQ